MYKPTYKPFVASIVLATTALQASGQDVIIQFNKNILGDHITFTSRVGGELEKGTFSLQSIAGFEDETRSYNDLPKEKKDKANYKGYTAIKKHPDNEGIEFGNPNKIESITVPAALFPKNGIQETTTQAKKETTYVLSNEEQKTLAAQRDPNTDGNKKNPQKTNQPQTKPNQRPNITMADLENNTPQQKEHPSPVQNIPDNYSTPAYQQAQTDPSESNQHLDKITGGAGGDKHGDTNGENAEQNTPTKDSDDTSDIEHDETNSILIPFENGSVKSLNTCEATREDFRTMKRYSFNQKEKLQVEMDIIAKILGLVDELDQENPEITVDFKKLKEKAKNIVTRKKAEKNADDRKKQSEKYDRLAAISEILASDAPFIEQLSHIYTTYKKNEKLHTEYRNISSPETQSGSVKETAKRRLGRVISVYQDPFGKLKEIIVSYSSLQERINTNKASINTIHQQCTGLLIDKARETDRFYSSRDDLNEQVTSLSEKNQKLTDQLDDLRGNLDNAQSMIENLNSERTEMIMIITTLEKENGELKESVQILNEALDGFELNLSNANKELEDLKTQYGGAIDYQESMKTTLIQLTSEHEKLKKLLKGYINAESRYLNTITQQKEYIASLEIDIHNKNQTINTLQKKLEQANDQRGEIEKQLGSNQNTQDQVAVLTYQNKDLQSTINNLEQQIKIQLQQLEELTQTMEKKSSTNHSDSIKIEDSQKQIANLTKGIEELQKDLTTERQSLSEEKNKNNQLLKELNDYKLQVLEQCEANKENIDRMALPVRIGSIKGMNVIPSLTDKNFHTTYANGLLDGTIPGPFPTGTKYRNTSKFGMRHLKGEAKPRQHHGIDMAVVEGTKIISSFDGIVKEVGFDKVKGHYLVLLSGFSNGDINLVEVTYSRYLHMKKAPHRNGTSLKKGDSIKAGDQLGEVGTTGRSSGPHLHFEMKRKNKLSSGLNIILDARKKIYKR